jgi:hypothetical protein
MKGLCLVGLALCCAAGLGCQQSLRQPLTPNQPGGRSLTMAQLDAIVTPTLSHCAPPERTAATGRNSGRIDPAAVIPSLNARAFPPARVAKTLHGIWRGSVEGDDSDVSVDYFWFIDTNKNEALIIAQRTGKQTLADMKPVPNAPHFSYLLCAHEGYFPSKDTPQMQEFVKVANDLTEVPRLMEAGTGLKVSELKSREKASLSEMWDGLHKMNYFREVEKRAKAFGGALFTGIRIAPSQGPIGPPHMSLSWNGTYYGGGSTAIRWTPDTPIKGVEYGTFVGTSATAGDFLVSSPGNGALWKVEAVAGGNYDLGFDSVVLGPMQP